jgi:hypothetical protein
MEPPSPQALHAASLAPDMHCTVLRATFDIFESERKSNMRRVFTIATTAAFFAALALAENLTGNLLDTSCLDQKKDVSACQANGTTTSFALQVQGKTYRLDDTGNQQAILALRNRADRSTDPTVAGGPVNAKITGTRDGEMIKVDSIEVQ